MCRYSVLAFTFLAIAVSVESFAPIQNVLARNVYDSSSAIKAESSPFDSIKDKLTSVSGDGSPFDDIKGKLTKVMDKNNIDQILGNALSGDFGERGEVYVATQVFLVLCILFGGLPILGDFLNLLCGPLLMLAGAATVALGVGDIGTSLSPWPVPTGDDLITDGVYSQVRHPIYAGLLAICAGFSVATGSAPRLLLTAALWYALDVKSEYEEKELIKERGAEYKAYQEEVTGKFFPAEIIAILPWTDSGDEGA